MPSHRSRSFVERIQVSITALGWPLVAFLCLAIVLGGGGVRHGLTNLVVQVVALALLLFQPGLVKRFICEAPRPLVALVGATLLLPLLQLIPLPPAIWQALPGREMAVESRDLVDAAGGWYPVTLDRARTVIALFALVGPLAILASYAFKSAEAPRAALGLLIVLTFAHFAFGVLQFAAGGDTLSFYETNREGRFYGFFISHIASGLFMVVGLCALIGHYLTSPRTRLRAALYAAGGALLVVGVILTNSRSAVALLAIPGLWAAVLGLRAVWGLAPKLRWGVLGAAALALLATGALFATNERLGETWERYQDLEDSRPDIWEDTMVGIDRYWPVGSGMGTFDEVFQVEESLEALVAKKAARAHNEYLEVLLEAGLFGAILVVGWLCYLGYAVIAGLRTVQAPVTLAAALAGLCFALQALIYFPLRNMAELCVAGLLVALLTAPLTIKRDRNIV